MNLEKMQHKYAYTLARVGLNVQPGQMPGMGNCNPGMQNSGNGMMPRNNTGRGSRSFPQMNQGQSGL